ncbi:MAG TPA: DNA repair protein Rad50, partial [Archangium sp.]
MLRAELAALLEARGFPVGLSPQRALALWRDAAEQRQRLADLGADERALAADEAACDAAVSRLVEEAREAGLPAGPVEAVAARVASALEELKARDAEARALRARADEWAGDRARFARLRESEEQALAALLARGGCGTEETFRQRARQAEHFEALTRRERELTWRIEAATGLEEPAVREAIQEAGGEERLKEKLAQLRMQEPACAGHLKVLHTEYGSTRSQLERWEGDEALAALRIQEERLRARAAELAARYATDRLGLALLARARRRFEEEQQPRVIQLTSEHFAALTAGRYRRVFIPAGGKRELRVSDARRDWSAEQLSRGTREQLYLAFRLAVIQDFGETRGALPLIVDDILVNFDLERTRCTLRLLSRLSKHHQVLAFTCHPWLRECFEAEGAKVVELPTRNTTTATPGWEPRPISPLPLGEGRGEGTRHPGCPHTVTQ